MRIVTWNINGIRTLPQYHPWNTLKTFDDILNHIDADIICFQEVKSSRQSLPKQVALPASYDGFFSFPLKKTGYSGVVTYTRSDIITPSKAEEGLTGFIQHRPPLSPEERISSSDNYPPNLDDRLIDSQEEVDFKDLDSEGRAVLLDLGLFVLINVYCPNDGTGTEEREKFKMDYHRLLETRVRTLIREEGREVMVVGDLNACAAVEDHCEGSLMVAKGLVEGLEGEEGFWGKDHRRWLRNWLVNDDGSTGCMVDIVRKFWPDRKGMYTCWNTKISARESNYGTRIDFILITPRLVPWIKAADIQPQVKGSDHCPVFVDLWDELTDPNDGSVTKLGDVLGVRRRPSSESGKSGSIEQLLPPRIAARYWEEHKQKLLSTFFVKKVEPTTSSFPKSTTPPCSTLSQHTSTSNVESQSLVNLESESADLTVPPEPPELTRSSNLKRKLSPVEAEKSLSEIPDKKKAKPLTQRQAKVLSKTQTKGKRSEPSSSQSTIASFFSQPKPSRTLSKTAVSPQPSLSSIQGSSPPKSPPKVRHKDANSTQTHDQQQDEDADYQLALLLSQSESSPPSTVASAESKQAWNTLLAPTQIPRCIVHGEPAKEFTVNKPGPNKGKRFFICSRPVGPGYDRGHAERLREQVDPQYRCNFFKWSSDARREMAKTNHERTTKKTG